MRVHKTGFVSVVSGTLLEGDMFSVQGQDVHVTEKVKEGGSLEVRMYPLRTHCVAVHRSDVTATS